jgi:tetraprenyl-beta-curcumene synthase
MASSIRIAPSRKMRLSEHLGLSAAFSRTALSYLFHVLPAVRAELAHWQAHAARIPNPGLRFHAREALLKRGNIEGAALFATLAPRRYRRLTVRALVAFQSAYNYLDALSEVPNKDPVANGARLHRALITAVHPCAQHCDYYEHNPEVDDGGYLVAMAEACRGALACLPSFCAITPTARAAAARIVDFQALNLSQAQGGYGAMRRWASEETMPGSRLQWWETAAAAGSSLPIHALIAAAAAPDVDSRDAREIDRAYFPWTGAVHSLLDSLVDLEEDHLQGRKSLLAYYRSPAEAAIRLGALASRARDVVERLPSRDTHRVILTAMCSYYLSAPETRGAGTFADNISEALGWPLSVTVGMFRIRRFASTLSHATYT